MEVPEQVRREEERSTPAVTVVRIEVSVLTDPQALRELQRPAQKPLAAQVKETGAASARTAPTSLVAY